MNRIEPEAACSRVVEEVALGIGGLFATGDLSERSADLIAELLDECLRRSRERCRREDGIPAKPNPLAARRHPKIEGLVAALRMDLVTHP